MPGGSKATPERKMRAAIALASGQGVTDVAKEIGVSRVTIHQWMARDEEFQRIRQELADATVAQAVQRLRSMADRAVATLEEMLAEKKVDEVRLRATDLILRRIKEFAPQLSVSVSGTLEERLRELDAESSEA